MVKLYSMNPHIVYKLECYMTHHLTMKIWRPSLSASDAEINLTLVMR